MRKHGMNGLKSLRAAIYVRVSTQDQRHDMQLSELRGYCERMGWSVVEYAEKMSSIKRRVVHEQVMAAARDRQFDVVVVWKLDRFARSLQQLLENMRLLDSYGVRFICVTQGIDTDRQNPASRLMLQIIGAVAEFERGLIAERVRSGMAEARRQGKQLGRPRRVWRRDEAVQLRLTGLSFREIAKRLGKPETTIRRAIQAAQQW